MNNHYSNRDFAFGFGVGGSVLTGKGQLVGFERMDMGGSHEIIS